MQQSLTISASTGAHSNENEILCDIERLLDKQPEAAPSAVDTKHPRARRLAPLVLLAGVGAALFALMPVGVKDTLMTGRSVSHSPDR